MEHDKAFSYSLHQEISEVLSRSSIEHKFPLQMGHSSIESSNDSQGWKNNLVL
jgi:hypothetical protein